VYTVVRKDAALPQPDSFANRMVLSVPYTPTRLTAFDSDVFNVLFGADTERAATLVAHLAANRYETECWVVPAKLSYMRDLSDCMAMSLAVIIGEEVAADGKEQEVHFHRARRFNAWPRAKR
jgi:histidyl-tRNA synthetase